MTWKVKTMKPSSNRGLWNLEVTDGEHIIRFEACSDGGTKSPLEWAEEQIAGMDKKSFAINCLRCPDKGESTRPVFWDEEAD